jgi:Histidine kinase-, DNA gyrase B-, and HSP90-like ATPase.
VKTQKHLHSALAFLAVFALALGCFYAAYSFDNKYTAQGPQPVSGILKLDEANLSEHPIVFLVRDWEIYRDRLLTPDDFISTPPLPDELTFIGQYGGFEGRVKDAPVRSPHGSATYRLNIILPEEPRSYTLELPEIYSAYKLYVNGVLMRQVGNPDPQNYHALTDTGSVMIHAGSRIEILIAVSDYAHFYSGIVYPPAFGETEAVMSHLGVRLILRTTACAIALCLAFLSLLCGLLIGKKGRNDEAPALTALYFGICLVFCVYTCYPVLKSVLPTGMWFYSVENLAWCMMPLLTMLVQKKISGLLPKWTNIFIAFGVLVCLWAALVPVFLGSSLKLMNAYSTLIGLYTWATALYLTLCAALSLQRGVLRSRFMLFALLIFDAALVADRIFPMFEPIRFGWFPELAGGTLVLCIGITMANEIAGEVRMRNAVEARAESVVKMLEVQKAYYPALLEKEQETKAARHDLRHHIGLFREMLERGDVDSLTRYLDEYSDTQPMPLRISYCGHYVTDMLLGMYAGLAEKQNSPIRIQAAVSDTLPISDVDLCVMLSNLLENALEASAKISEPEREIIVRIGEKRRHFILLIENVFDGTVIKDTDKILSAKCQGRGGVGIASVRSIAEKYMGETEFYGEGNRFYSEVYLPIHKGV